VRFDATGKVSLDHIYTQPDPRSYFRALRPLGYCVPQHAKPYFAKFIKEYQEYQEYQESRPVAVPKVLDIGCSYGINAALLKYDATMDELYERYGDEDREGESREALLARDRDTSGSALAYALEAGFLDDAVHADLENNDPTPRQLDQLSGTDLVISTGCLGYVTERTLMRIVRAQGDRRPWMAHFVLRMFPFDSVERALAGLGYRTVRVDDVFKQRRFASPEEQALVVDSMASAGVDGRGLEAEGWLYAQLYLSRPYGTSGPNDPNREQK
jgi:SAM-dependent methyltransferase